MDDVIKNAYQWRLAFPGIFKIYNIAPVAELEQAAPLLAKMVRKLKK